MKVLIDTNVILDVLLTREPWFAAAAEVWAACETGRVSGYLSASAMTDIFYITRRSLDVERALRSIDLCLQTFAIVPVDRAVVEQARALATRTLKIMCRPSAQSMLAPMQS